MRLEIETPIISLLILSAGPLSTAFNIKLRDNPLGIDFDPAPSPEDGPPLSAGALRDPAYLPAEIGGIVGAYVFIVSVVGIALLTVGRRLRNETRSSKAALDVEMVQPQIAAHQYPSPISPVSSQGGAKNFSWPSPEKTDRNAYVFPATSQPPTSPGKHPSVDRRVVESDREQLQKGLEDLYAHVMAQEEAKTAAKSGAPVLQRPHSPLPLQREPLPATSPQRLPKKPEKPRPAGINVEQSKAEKTQSRASSFMSALKSPRKKSVRTLQISSPIPTPISQTFPRGYASDEEPLSPIHYSPPPPPPIPKDQVPYSHSRNNSSSPSTDPSPVSPTRSIAEQLANSNVPQHNYNRSQSSIQSAGNPPRVNPARNLPAIVTANTHNPPPNNGSTRTLPFRAYDPPGLSSPTFSQATKTTVLERTSPAVVSPGLRTPWTAGAVPYSPYQPRTPMLPISPRLVTKEDRKRMKKLEGRTPVLEMIKSEEELWDSVY